MAADDGNCRAIFGGEILESNDHVRDSALDPRCLRKGNDDAGETVGLQDSRFEESERLSPVAVTRLLPQGRVGRLNPKTTQ